MPVTGMDLTVATILPTVVVTILPTVVVTILLTVVVTIPTMVLLPLSTGREAVELPVLPFLKTGEVEEVMAQP